MNKLIVLATFLLFWGMFFINSQAQYRENKTPDALPNPFSEEGIKKLQVWTNAKLITINKDIETKVLQVMNLFKESISQNDYIMFKTVAKLKDKPEESTYELFTKIVEDRIKYNINLNEYSFGFSKINSASNTVSVIMLNKDKILTAEFSLEKVENKWSIYSIKI